MSAVSHWLNRVLEVWRPVTTADGAGGQVVTEVLAGTVRAKVDQPAAAERTLAQQAGAAHTLPVYLEPGAAVARGDQLRDGDERWRVLAVVSPSSVRYRRADCELIQPEGNPA